jgi:integrase
MPTNGMNLLGSNVDTHVVPQTMTQQTILVVADRSGAGVEPVIQIRGADQAPQATAEVHPAVDAPQYFHKTTAANGQDKLPEYVQMLNHLAAMQDFVAPARPKQREEILSLQEIRARWAFRPLSIREMTTQKWQDVQEKYLYLMAFTQEVREVMFQELISFYDWSYKTAQKNWSALIRGAQTIELPITQAMAAQASVFHFMAQEEEARKPTVPATLAEIVKASEVLPEHLAAALKLAFLLGQRMGDVLNLRSRCTSCIKDAATSAAFLTILFRVGKTTRKTQPYRLHLPVDHEVAKALKNLDENRPEQYLFVSHDVNAKSQALATIKAALVGVNTNLMVLSVRRGGLQAMALAGCSTETLLAHSRHRSLDTLNRYLNWGEVQLTAAKERWHIAEPILQGINLVQQDGGLTAPLEDQVDLGKLFIESLD